MSGFYSLLMSKSGAAGKRQSWLTRTTKLLIPNNDRTVPFAHNNHFSIR
jgi:hypothetical protein